MKKIAALILALALCLSMLPGTASASHLTEDEMTKLTEYSYDLAMTYIADHEWEGLTWNVEGANAKFWLPWDLFQVEMKEKVSGLLGYYISENLQVRVSVVNYGELSPEDYLQSVIDNGYRNARIVPVNGVDFVIYDEPIKNIPLCRVAATQASSGVYLEFIYYAADGKLSDQINGSIATIRFVD